MREDEPERLPYGVIWLNDNALALSRLSIPWGTSAYALLWHEYHVSGGLPNSDTEVRKIAGLAGNKKWDVVRPQLIAAGFKKDWTNPVLDAGMARTAKNRRRAQNGGNKKAENMAVAPADDSEADIPF
jgi:uncharacterized protein YdaU (DUF1376 family)